MITKVLISCTVTTQLIYAFVFAYGKSRFSHEAALLFFHQISPRTVVANDFFPMTGVSYSYAQGSAPSEDSFSDVSFCSSNQFRGLDGPFSSVGSVSLLVFRSSQV